MKKIVIALSGGLDSSTLLSLLLQEKNEIHCCFFNYGSKHNIFEKKAVLQIIEHYKKEGAFIFFYDIDLEQVFRHTSSNLLLTGGEIPEGHYEHKSMKKTVVPGRNLIFASVMSSIAESIEADYIALGVHSGDHAIYPDCRPDFIEALQKVIHTSTDKMIKVYTPFLHLNKTDILRKGMELGTPYHLTRTCYKNQEHSCGKCGSCQERLEAFNNINNIDPINYEGRQKR